jgi:hypothetical protein
MARVSRTDRNPEDVFRSKASTVEQGASDLPLFAGPLARSCDPETSHEAAEEIRVKGRGLKGQILLVMQASARADWTAGEMADALNLHTSQIGKRFSELVDEGYIVECDAVVRVYAGSGAKQNAHAITAKGRAVRIV